MRVLLKFKSSVDFNYDYVNKYMIQSFIYSSLRDNLTFSNFHNVKGFKFFNFSNIFPVSNFKTGDIKNLIISSPIDSFIQVLFDNLKSKGSFRFGAYKFEIVDIKIIRPKLSGKFISSTPIVLFEDNKSNKYYSFEKDPDFDFFFSRLKNNALKKFNAYTGDNFVLDDDLFDSFEYKREVSVRVRKNDNTFVIIGSLWDSLEVNINRRNKEFYRFILESGLGEKNSLGFGMINSVR